MCILQTKEHETVAESLEEYKSRLDQTSRQLEETETRLTEKEHTLEKVRHTVSFGIIFLPVSLNMCFGCSKEPSH